MAFLQDAANGVGRGGASGGMRGGGYVNLHNFVLLGFHISSINRFVPIKCVFGSICVEKTF